jgi:hypothetical protein
MQQPVERRRGVQWLVRVWPAVALGVGVAAVGLGAVSSPREAPRAAVEPVLAVIFPGVGPNGLEALGLLDRLRRPNPPGMLWLGGDLIEIPGASGAQLWARAVTGRIRPEPGDADLFKRDGIPVYGEWDAPPDPAHDRAVLADARAQIASAGGRIPGGVVLLSCPQVLTDLAAGPCRDAFLEAVDLLEDVARRGGTGLLLAVPLRGFPQIGTVWAIGREVQEGVDFRFRMIDVVPTLLRLLDLPAPPVIDGGPAYDMMRFEHLFHRPLRWEGGGT